MSLDLEVEDGPVPQGIVVVSPSLPGDLVLVDSKWMSALASIGERVKTLKIVTADQAQIAADLQGRLTVAGRQLKDAHAALKAPVLARGRAIDAAAKGPEETIEALKQTLKQGLRDFDEAERKRGVSPERAIMEACKSRFRPITMTTLAAVLGAVPLAIGTGTGSEMRQPLGISIVGGLLVSQMLTLYTTPVVYLVLPRIVAWCKRAPAQAANFLKFLAENA